MNSQKSLSPGKLIVVLTLVFIILLGFSTIQFGSEVAANISNSELQQPESNDNNIPNRKPLNDEDIVELSAPFGMRMHPVLKERRMHLGVDFIAEEGKPIFATADGVVSKIQTSPPGEGYGNLVAIKHSGSVVTQYAHMSGFNNINEGQKIKKGDIIGYVGSSGKSFGPHLHYEVIVNNKRVDPADYFE